MEDRRSCGLGRAVRRGPRNYGNPSLSHVINHLLHAPRLPASHCRPSCSTVIRRWRPPSLSAYSRSTPSVGLLFRFVARRAGRRMRSGPRRHSTHHRISLYNDGGGGGARIARGFQRGGLQPQWALCVPGSPIQGGTGAGLPQRALRVCVCVCVCG